MDVIAKDRLDSKLPFDHRIPPADVDENSRMAGGITHAGLEVLEIVVAVVAKTQLIFEGLHCPLAWHVIVALRLPVRATYPA